MKKQEVPKIVAEVLKEISSTIKDYNAESNLKMLAKTSESFLLKIFPQNYEIYFFQIESYVLGNITTDTSFKVLTDGYIFELMCQKDSVVKNLFNIDTIPKSYLTYVIDIYLRVLRDIHPTLIGYENTEIDFTDFFEIEQEEELIPEPDFYESKERILPYSLKQISVKDFQGVKETEIEHIPVDTQWIFLVGENGFGKTTILQSIFLGLNGVFDGTMYLLDDKNSSIQIEYKSLEGSLINSIKDNKHPLIHLAAYGPGRLNLQGMSNENAEERNNSISNNLFNSDGNLFNINALLKDSSLKKDERFKLIRKAICTLIPNLSDVKYNQETDQIEYIEKEINNDEQNITYQPSPFKKLASGFKSIIALAGDMIVRLSKNQPEVKDPSELKGIVLIDEIDLHLHPKLQKQLIGQFSKVFPKIQFIVSTHSPIPLLGAESNSVILKVNRTKERGIQIEHVDINLKNLTPNLVLTSGIFDMEDFISVQNENINEVRTEDSMTEKEENDKVVKSLEEFEKSDVNFPDELFLPKTKK